MHSHEWLRGSGAAGCAAVSQAAPGAASAVMGGTAKGVAEDSGAAYRVMHMQCVGLLMKSATIPPLRVTPELRREVESVLKDGESLSGFVEDSLKRQIQHRKNQKTFLERGLAAREAAKATGEYFDKDEVMESLQSILEAAQHQG